VAMVTEQKMS